MVQFSPVKEAELPKLPSPWEWGWSKRDWQVEHPDRGAIWLDSDGDLAFEDDYAFLSRQLIKPLYVANGVEL